MPVPNKYIKVTRYYDNKTEEGPYITAEFKAEKYEDYKNFVVGSSDLFPTTNRRKRSGE